jgi:hypothetical protein
MTAHANGNGLDVLIDAIVAAGSAAFAVLSSIALGVLKAEPVAALLAAGVAGGMTFFGSLGAARRRIR